MLGLTGEPLLGELLLGELLPTPLNMLARSQRVSQRVSQSRWALAPCSLLLWVGMEGQDSPRDARRRSKEQLLGGSSPNAGEQQQRWRHI